MPSITRRGARWAVTQRGALRALTHTRDEAEEIAALLQAHDETAARHKEITMHRTLSDLTPMDLDEMRTRLRDLVDSYGLTDARIHVALHEAPQRYVDLVASMPGGERRVDINARLRTDYEVASTPALGRAVELVAYGQHRKLVREGDADCA